MNFWGFEAELLCYTMRSVMQSTLDRHPGRIKTAVFSLIIFASGLILFTGRAEAQSWVYIGPDEGQVSAMALDPENPGILFAAMINDAVYKTANAMGSPAGGVNVAWDRLPAFYSCYHVSGISIHMEVIFVLEGGG